MGTMKIQIEADIFDDPEYCGGCGFQQYAVNGDLCCGLFLGAGRIQTFLKECSSNKRANKLQRCKEAWKKAKESGIKAVRKELYSEQ